MQTYDPMAVVETYRESSVREIKKAMKELEEARKCLRELVWIKESQGWEADMQKQRIEEMHAWFEWTQSIRRKDGAPAREALMEAYGKAVDDFGWDSRFYSFTAERTKGPQCDICDKPSGDWVDNSKFIVTVNKMLFGKCTVCDECLYSDFGEMDYVEWPVREFSAWLAEQGPASEDKRETITDN